MNNDASLYEKGNPFQKKVYRKMSSFLESNSEIKAFGKSRSGNYYKHLLTDEQSEFNFINKEIQKDTIERFSKHKAGDLNRIMTNTAASQPYCFNIIIHLKQNPLLANKLFSKLLNKVVKVQHIEPEFTPNCCDDIVGFERISDESIGDQNFQLGFGTDADIAVFYNYENSKKGILIIEFKFIEAEFSVCTSYKGSKKKPNETPEEKQLRINRNNERQAICHSNNFYENLVITKNSLCGYNKYFNWDLTAKSKVIDINKIKSMLVCPFAFGLNQLWRNILLAEQVASARNCDEFGFWVFSPKENDDFLWKKGKTENEFRHVLTEQGNNHFKKVYLETIFEIFHSIISEPKNKVWLSAMEEKYKI